MTNRVEEMNKYVLLKKIKNNGLMPIAVTQIKMSARASKNAKKHSSANAKKAPINASVTYTDHFRSASVSFLRFRLPHLRRHTKFYLSHEPIVVGYAYRNEIEPVVHNINVVERIFQ